MIFLQLYSMGYNTLYTANCACHKIIYCVQVPIVSLLVCMYNFQGHIDIPNFIIPLYMNQFPSCYSSSHSYYITASVFIKVVWRCVFTVWLFMEHMWPVVMSLIHILYFNWYWQILQHLFRYTVHYMKLLSLFYAAMCKDWLYEEFKSHKM